MNSEQLKAYIGVAHYVQQQADWNETDVDSVQYIKNKPSIDITDFRNDFDNHVSFVAQKINDLQNTNDTQDSQISNLGTDMSDAQTRIGDLSVKSNDHINRIIALENKANTNTSNIAQVDTDLQTHAQFAGNRFNNIDIEIDKLKTDTSALDTSITALQANVVTLQATDRGYDTRISAVESNTTSNTSRIGTLEATTSLTLPTLDAECKTLKTRLDNIEGRVIVLENFKTLVETKISDLTNRIKALEGNS